MSTQNQLRAVGYSRTSGEGQRDNTSIPRQKQSIEGFCSVNQWAFLKHYVDECKSGKNIDGRDDFKRMLQDAANSVFDLIVIYDIKRFGRDSADIMSTSKFLRSNFGIHVVDTKNN